MSKENNMGHIIKIETTDSHISKQLVSKFISKVLTNRRKKNTTGNTSHSLS